MIHRDIKPSNILLTLDDPPTLRLIDFGIARPFRIGTPIHRDPIQERRNVPETLHWVSLNAQLGYCVFCTTVALAIFATLHDLDTSRRDDVESLAYTLLFLLRGSLPWQRYNTHSGTLFGNMKEVREKKRRWPGQRLGEGMAKEFGDLLDYARALEFEEEPDYEDLRSSFQRLVGDQSDGTLDIYGHSLPSASSPLINSTTALPALPTRPAPVSRGQLIYVKLIPYLTIAGYTVQAMDSSHWEDTSLLGREWETKKRPAVVLDVEQMNGDKYWRVKVLPLRRDVNETTKGDNTVIRATPQTMEPGVGNQWLWEKVIVFAFPTAETFVCVPDQVRPSHTIFRLLRHSNP